MQTQIKILSGITQTVSSDSIEKALIACANNTAELENFTNEYFHNGSTDLDKHYREQFLTNLEACVDSGHVSEYFKNILYFALIIGFPSLDYLYIVFDKKLHESGKDLMEPFEFENFIKGIYKHMLQKALRFLLFKKYLESLGVKNAGNLYMVNNKSDMFPSLEMYGDLELATKGDFDNVTNDVYQSAVVYDEFINTMLFEVPSRQGYGLKDILLKDELSTLGNLYESYKSLALASGV